jgi:glycosyltransferase involved in cell wall biosynthesis
VEKHLEKISQILSKKNQITIITEQYETNLPEKEQFPEALTYRIPLSGTERSKKFIIWKWFFHNLNLLMKADVIHIHDVYFWILPFRVFLPKKKFFITFHGYEGSKNPGIRQVLWHKLGEWGSSGNICIGDFHRKWYKTNPDIVSYGAANDVKETVTKKGDTIMYLGRLDQDTGILDYLRAAARLGYGLDVYGDGPYMAQAKEIAEQLHLRCSFLGFVPDASKYIKKYRIVFTSRYLGILEALISKVHVISHYDSEIKFDYLAQAPFADFIEICSDDEDIYTATTKIIRKPDLYQSRLKQGYNWAKAQTWQKMANQYEELWKKTDQN